MKRTVFIQSVPHYPTAWGDATQAWNVASLWKGMGIWSVRSYNQKIRFWTKQNFNIILDVDKENPDSLLLTHFFNQVSAETGSNLRKPIDLTAAFEYLDADPKKGTCAFGVFFDPQKDKLDSDFIFNESIWFTREPHPTVVNTEQETENALDMKFIDLKTMKPLNVNASDMMSITWFFMYRTDELPIYYIIPNPEMMGIAPDIDAASNDNVRYMGITPHFGSVGDWIFRPSYSSNVVELSPTKIVAGDKFHITPFEKGVFRWGFKETVPPVNIKVFSNLDYVKEENSNKIIFTFLPGQEQGYIHLRWNNSTVMDLTQSSRSLDNLENKCQVTFDVYKKDKYRYKEN